MTYLIGFFSSLLTNNVVTLGYGISGVSHTSTHRVKKFTLFVIFYLIAGIAMGLSAWGMASFEATYPILQYFEIVIYAVIIAILALIFYGLASAFHASKEFKEDILPFVINTSLYGICLFVSSLISNGNSDIIYIIVNSLGLALGYVCTIVVFKPIAERIEASNAGLGFKGIPLILILLAILCLALGSLSF